MTPENVNRKEHILVYARDLLYFFDLALYIGIYATPELREEFQDKFDFTWIEYGTYENCLYRYYMREEFDFFYEISHGGCTREEVYSYIDALIDMITLEVIEQEVVFTNLFSGIIMSMNLREVERLDIYIDNPAEAVIIHGLLGRENGERIALLVEEPKEYSEYTCVFYNDVMKLVEHIKENKLQPTTSVGLAMTGYNTFYSEETKMRHLKQMKDFIFERNVSLISLFKNTEGHDIYG